ncbi:hypothetical protein GCM10022393_05150 [Aquimarina addita]|uniref:Signal transduction histidine kinase internal region domain-containing protein n=1 Tax=Aquimarina addita TaxID=870485 RepID=A0ABP7X9Z0_9FLAO
MRTKLLILCFFGASFIGIAQKESVEILFANRAYDSVISILTKKESKTELSMREFFLLTRSYGRTGQFSNGYVLASKMIEVAMQNKDTVSLLKAYNLKAEQITDLEKIKEGVKFCDSVIPFFREKDSIELMKLCFKCGVLYNYNDQPKKAYNTYLKITKKEYKNLPLYSSNFGLILASMRKEDEAIAYFEKSIQHYIDNNRLQRLNKPLMNIGRIYLLKQDWEQSKKFLDSAYKMLKFNNSSTLKEPIFENYYHLYQFQKKTEEAARFLDSIYINNESLLEQKVTEKINSIEAANEGETRLVKRVKIIDQQLSDFENKKLKGIIILLSILLVLLVILFAFIYKNINAAYQNAITEQRLRWSKMNPDFLFDSLSLLQNMITAREPKSIKYLSKFSKYLRLILESSRGNLISIQDELTAIGYYVALQQMKTDTLIDFTLHTDEELEDKEIYIPPMLIQPFIEKALENNDTTGIEKTTLTVTTSFINNQLICSIENRGSYLQKNTVINYTKDQETIKNIRKRLTIFSKKFKVFVDLKIENKNTDKQQGTKVILTLPYKEEL